MEKKVLVLVQSYPGKNNVYSQAYVHARSLYYKQHHVAVDVLSFSSGVQYTFEGITVHPASAFRHLIRDNRYAAVICHAPNIRNHMRLLLPIIKTLPKIFFIFHGHEILKTSLYYPKAYSFDRGPLYPLRRKSGDLYDVIKCLAMKHIIKKFGGDKIHLIFVSEYLMRLFERNVGLQQKEINGFSSVIHNPLHPAFMDGQYSWRQSKQYDFITIRPFDGSVYALDLLVKAARQNPGFSFHVYGEGRFFDHHSYPANLKVIKRFLPPDSIPGILNSYRAAFMPSYHDTQGVMACEMAAFGIPLVASDIPATREMFKDAGNILLLNNAMPEFNAGEFLSGIIRKSDATLKRRLAEENTVGRELALICC